MSIIQWEDVVGFTGCSVGVIGPYRINAFGNGYWGSWQMRRHGDMHVIAGEDLPETRERPPTLEAAKLRAEEFVLEMHAALTEHQALALRWKPDGGIWSSASLGPWRLLASDEGDWMVYAPGSIRVASGRCRLASESREAAEMALRNLGVAFRTEAE